MGTFWDSLKKSGYKVLGIVLLLKDLDSLAETGAVVNRNVSIESYSAIALYDESLVG